jgi:hypothetical protein
LYSDITTRETSAKKIARDPYLRKQCQQRESNIGRKYNDDGREQIWKSPVTEMVAAALSNDQQSANELVILVSPTAAMARKRTVARSVRW